MRNAECLKQAKPVRLYDQGYAITAERDAYGTGLITAERDAYSTITKQAKPVGD